MKPIKLGADLEKALLKGIVEGISSPESVDPQELSKKGKVIHGAAVYLLRKGATAPFKHTAITLAANHLYASNRDEVGAYLRSLEEHSTGSEINTLLRAARDKAALVALVNQAGEQLASGDLRVSDLTSILATQHSSGPVKSLAEVVGRRWPRAPRGIDIPSLPIISENSRGLFGVWAIAGEPGLGKSTLTWQIALDVSRSVPVFYYDLDGTGEEFFIERTRAIVGSDFTRFRRFTKNLFFRHNIASFEEDIARFPAPALFVIDSIQTLPASVRFAKESLDNWIRRFKETARKGYPVLTVSEKQRSEYGEANISGFKGSGDIEYGVTVGIQLLGYDDDETLVKCILVKSRHSKRKGHIIDLERDEDKTFWWKERKVRYDADTVSNNQRSRRSQRRAA